MCLKKNVLIYHTGESHNFEEIIVSHLICQCLPSLSAGDIFAWMAIGLHIVHVVTAQNLCKLYIYATVLSDTYKYNMLHFYDIIVVSECVTEYIVVIFIR